MRNKKQTDPRWTIEVRDDARANSPVHSDDGDQKYEQVGNKLITTYLIDELLDHVDGKTIAQPFVISIPELLDNEFLSCYLDCQRAVMAECLVHLLTTNRIVIRTAH
jgi:hypothetical protein